MEEEEFEIIEKESSNKKLPTENEDEFIEFESIFTINSKNISNGNSNYLNFESLSINDFDQISTYSNISITRNLSIWENIKKYSKDFKDIFIFNYLPSENKLKIKTKSNIQIFNKKNFSDNQILEILSNIVWYSYRKNFTELIFDNKHFTSDAGWGCMIRAGQMILSQAIYKLFAIEKLEDFLNKFIYLFLDCKIPIHYLNCNLGMSESNFENDLINSDFTDLNIKIFGFEELIKKKQGNSNYESVNKFFPPFSLINISQRNQHSNKGPGHWFSNYEFLEIIEKAMNDYHPLNYFGSELEIEIVNFPEGTVYLEEIVNKSFVEVKCSCKNSYNIIEDDNKITEKEIDEGFIVMDNKKTSKNSKKNKICNCFKNSINFGYNLKKEFSNDETVKNDFNIQQYLNLHNKYYKMNKKLILFVSCRQGLYCLDQTKYEQILDIFDCPSSIGIIGGKKSRAFYFIGKSNKNLIFLDPHHVQNNIDFEKFIMEGKDKETFRPIDTFYMKIKDMSPSFSLGFVFNSIEEFLDFIQRFGTKNNIDDNNKIYMNLSSDFDNIFTIKLLSTPINFQTLQKIEPFISYNKNKL
jgi:hypothetical protein